MADTFKLEFEGSVEQWVADLFPRIHEAQKAGLLEAAEYAVGEVRRAAFEAFPGSRGGLARSYTATLLQPKDGKLRSGAVSDLVYARIQDEGGEIVPRTAKALTIPISNRAKQMSARGLGAREFPAKLALIWPQGKTSGILAESIRGKLKVHYLLKKRVELDGTHYLDDAARNAEEEIAEILDAHLGKAGREAEAGGE